MLIKTFKEASKQAIHHISTKPFTNISLDNKQNGLQKQLEKDSLLPYIQMLIILTEISTSRPTYEHVGIIIDTFLNPQALQD